MATGQDIISQVLNRSEPVHRCYCHSCRKNFIRAVASEELKCPSCNSEFVEELEEEEERTAGGSRLSRGGGRAEEEGGGRADEEGGGRADEVEGSGVEGRGDDYRDFLQPPSVRRRIAFEVDGPSTQRTVRIGLPRHALLVQRPPPLAFLLQQYMERLANYRDSDSNTVHAPLFLPTPMLLGVPLGVGSGGLHGSPQDYAWGPRGLDNVISRLLEQLEDSGPPPADKDKVDSLPAVSFTQEDRQTCNECTVCKEVFVIDDKLLKLPCEHLFHKDCILPWLQLHDTCPTCRYSVNTGVKS